MIRGSWVLACLVAGCAGGAPSYRGFADVPYGYAQARTIWGERAQAWVHVAECEGAGGGIPLVLVHPWGTNMLIWSDVAPALAEGRRVVLVDLPGHGKSSKSFGSYPVRRLAAAVVDALDAAGLQRVILAGNSLGGATAIEVALRAPSRVAGLVLIGAPGGKRVPGPIQAMVRRATQPRALATLNDEALAISWWAVTPNMRPLAVRLRDDGIALKRTGEWRDYARATSSALAEVAAYTPELERIRARVLVVQGEDDLVVAPDYGEAMAARIPGAALAKLADCGHVPQLECPEALLQVMSPFLATFTPGERSRP